jgi:hypothetical protein
MRQFIRHPVDVPVEVRARGSGTATALHTHDIGLGGLAIQSESEVSVGSIVDIRIACVQPPFSAHARVAWCHPRNGQGFDIGVTFLDAEDAFLARMVEQVCHIEEYRKSVQRTERRVLSSEEAALEWIDKHAARFPDIDAQSH